MIIAPFSDLHVEFPSQPDFFDGLDTTGVDLAILAGDILLERNSKSFLVEFCSRYPKVLYVAGNHEHYRGEFNTTYRHLHDLKIDNLTFLEQETCTINDQRFIGCTLWYNGGLDCLANEMFINDFRLIYNKERPFRQTIYQYARESKAFLRENIKKDDVVITHMLPSEACVDEKFRGESTNPFYFNECSSIIRDTQPKLWIHGHSHNFLDTTIYDTRVVRNPRGYPGEADVNFNKNFKIEI